MSEENIVRSSYGSGPRLTSRPLRGPRRGHATPQLLQDHYQVAAEALADEMVARARRLALLFERVFG